MAKRDNSLSEEDAVHLVSFADDTDTKALMRWIRYRGKGRFRAMLFVNTRTFSPYMKIRFTDADTAFWAKMKFA